MQIDSMVTITGAEYERLRADNERLREALRYSRRFLNSRDHDTGYVDAVLGFTPVPNAQPAPGKEEDND